MVKKEIKISIYELLLMVEIFRLRRRKNPMYKYGVYCSKCEEWFSIKECDKGKNEVLLCPYCHKIVRRNRRNK